MPFFVRPMGCGASSEAGQGPEDAPQKPAALAAPTAPTASSVLPAGDEGGSPKFFPSQRERGTLDKEFLSAPLDDKAQAAQAAAAAKNTSPHIAATHVPSSNRRPSLDEQFQSAEAVLPTSHVPSGALSLDDKFKAAQAAQAEQAADEDAVAEAVSATFVPSGGALSLDDKFKAAQAAEEAAEVSPAPDDEAAVAAVAAVVAVVAVAPDDEALAAPDDEAAPPPEEAAEVAPPPEEAAPLPEEVAEAAEAAPPLEEAAEVAPAEEAAETAPPLAEAAAAPAEVDSPPVESSFDVDENGESVRVSLSVETPRA